MKQGKTLTDLAIEIDRRANAKKDMVADTREIEIKQAQPEIPSDYGQDTAPVYAAHAAKWSAADTVLRVNGMGEFPLTAHSHGQISTHTKIPKRYYDLMLQESPELLSRNVNHWFRENPKRRMVRTLDGNARAFLSDRYRIIDNDEVLESILPVISELGDVRIASTEVTDRRLYLKVLFPKIQGEIKKGDVVESGFVLSNSEIGQGRLSVSPLVHRLVCLNGMIAKDYGLSKFHVGRVIGQGQEAQEFFKDDTLRADDEAFLLKLRDTVRAAADESHFKMITEKMRAATENKIEGDLLKVTEVVQKKIGMNDGERTGVLQHLIEGGDLSQYGLMNAITRMSQDVDDYDRATDFERTGGQIIELKPSEWREIAQAA